MDEEIINSLKARAGAGDRAVMKSAELRGLTDELKLLPNDQKRDYGRKLNELRAELVSLLDDANDVIIQKSPIDVTSPWDINTSLSNKPDIFRANEGSIHPLNQEINSIIDIFVRMGFDVRESRQIDSDYNMFTALNFPEGHPARDDFDTFITDDGLVAPAHTSTMQNRILSEGKKLLDEDQAIACIIPGRVFRNEDLDATHEHTFHQIEGLYVDKGVTVGALIATLKAFIKEYFGDELAVKMQPFYFPFTEPSFELAVERPLALRKDNSEEQKWLELLGCGMIHPNVLTEAGVDPEVYSGFAWGMGVERMVMMKNNIEDIRHFNSGKLNFLRQF